MNKIVAMCLLVMLAGCARTINGHDVQNAVDYCEDKGGVYEIGTDLNLRVTCNHSAQYKLLYEVRESLPDKVVTYD